MALPLIGALSGGAGGIGVGGGSSVGDTQTGAIDLSPNIGGVFGSPASGMPKTSTLIVGGVLILGVLAVAYGALRK